MQGRSAEESRIAKLDEHAAHRLKGAAANLEDPEVPGTAARIEQAAAAGQISEDKLARLQQEIEQLKKNLQTLIHSLAA